MWARSSARLERRTLKPENGEEIRRSRVQFPSGPPQVPNPNGFHASLITGTPNIVWTTVPTVAAAFVYATVAL